MSDYQRTFVELVNQRDLFYWNVFLGLVALYLFYRLARRLFVVLLSVGVTVVLLALIWGYFSS